MIRWVITPPRVSEWGKQWIIGHPSNDAILAYCDTREEAERAARVLVTLVAAVASIASKPEG